MYQTVIFDLDGTLLDTLDDLMAAVNHVLREGGYPERNREEVRQFVGNGIGLLVKRALPEHVTDEEWQRRLESFRKYYTKHCKEATKPYDGILELIDGLRERGRLVGIVSNKNDRAVKELAKLYFPQMQVAIGEREGIRRKPEPDSVIEAMSQLKASKETTLYVGDSEVDFETARRAGIDCVLVSWGFRPKELLVALEPLAVIDKPKQLLSLLR